MKIEPKAFGMKAECAFLTPLELHGSSEVNVDLVDVSWPLTVVIAFNWPVHAGSLTMSLTLLGTLLGSALW